MTDTAIFLSHIIIKRKCIYARFMLLADSWSALIKNELPDINNHWLSCDSWQPKGARHVWGRSVKCLGLIAGVSFARLTASPCSLLFRTRSQFRSLRMFCLETPATQATKQLQLILMSMSPFWLCYTNMASNWLGESVLIVQKLQLVAISREQECFV